MFCFSSWMRALLLGSCLCALSALAERATITFPARDTLTITADVYQVHESKATPFVLLFHQARWSRGEYLRIAPWLNELGYNCMSVDLRAGKTILGIPNETALRARKQGKETSCCLSEPDIIAAVKHVRKTYADGPLILVGSSFSASLVLRIAGEKPKLVDGVAAFSPGEYFVSEGKCADWTQQSAAKIKTCPVFIAWSDKDNPAERRIAKAIQSKDLAVFVPDKDGQHGARALWEENPTSAQYRAAFAAFLNSHFPTAED